MSQPNTPKSVLEMVRDTAFNVTEAAKCKIADTTEAVKQALVNATAEKASSVTEAAKEPKQPLSNAVDFVKDTEKVKDMLFYVFTKLCFLIQILIDFAKEVTAPKLSGIREATKETLPSAAECTKQAACSSKDALIGKAEDLEEKDRDLGNASAENASEVPDKRKEKAQELVDVSHERAENIKQAGKDVANKAVLGAIVDQGEVTQGQIKQILKNDMFRARKFKKQVSRMNQRAKKLD